MTRKTKITLFLLNFGILRCLFAAPISEAKLQTCYNSLDPRSVSQHLAYYELYSQTAWGLKALRDAERLLAGHAIPKQILDVDTSQSRECLQAVIRLVNKPVDQDMPSLPLHSLEVINLFSRRLPHHHLKGHYTWNEEELLSLPLEEIDLARGLFLSQFGTDRLKIQAYEAVIDLMALQILARLPIHATPEEKIIAINTFIFNEMRFRFPPHSLSTKNIDLYTFLPSVLDSRRGVCLGVSILYLCIAQRLSLPLEMITPPGHIYVRYKSGDRIINIETTARGIDLDSDEYLSMSNRALQERTILEVIGMAHFNQASTFWQNGDYQRALEAYQKAEPYMKDDAHLTELMGYVLLLTGQKEKGETKLNIIKDFIPDYAMIKNTIAEDYFSGHIDAEGIGVIFSKAEEDRQSLLKKKEVIEDTLKKFPLFRAGRLSLALTWMQLHRPSEALDVLKTYQSIDDKDPEVHYYMTVLYAQRRDFCAAWQHFQKAEDIVTKHDYHPKILKELKRELLRCCPQ